jgi:predicted LPLAT superfamily acyltransferase
MMSGLATTFLAVSYTLKKTPQTLASSTEIGTSNGFKRLRFLPVVIFIALIPCFIFIQFGTDLQDFHSPSEALRAAEKRFHELTFPSADPKTHGLLVIEGDSIEAVLEREEALALPAKIPHVSNFLPSLAKRQALYPHLKALYETEGATLIESLGIDTLPTLTPPRAWTTENVPALLLDNFFIQCSDGRFLTVIPNVAAPETLPEGVFHYNPQRVMQQTIDRLSHLTRCLLFTVGLILIGILCIVFRKKAILIALPSLLAIGIVFVCFGTRGQTLNLFHLLACFMLLGMSLDYTIFFASGERHAWKPITCSFITSLAGFGALAFVSFMVVRSIGQVFAVGLTASYTAAWLLFWGKSAPNNEAKPKTEVAASVIGLQIVLWIYRLLGKWAMDLSGAVVANTLWFTSAKIRRFTHSRKRLTLFVQSMVDKFVVMSCGRGQPRVEFAEDADTQAFVSDVRQRKGVFLLTSHFGAVEILPAADQEAVPLHAFMHIEQTAIFNRFYFDHFKRPTVHIHPVSSFGMGELFEAGDYLDQGDCILMAADRAFGMPQSVTFMGKPATFPKGVYRFAKLLEHPIYFVVCYRIRRNHYRVEARPLSAEQDLLTQFIAALEPLVQAHPEQWYNWELL